jgi:hypothetical protein
MTLDDIFEEIVKLFLTLKKFLSPKLSLKIL